MTTPPNPQRDEILAKLDVEQFYAGEGVELNEDPPGSGQYKALCPFHQENTGSFSVSSKGLYYCFGCSEKGSPFDFYMKKHSVEFTEAFEALASLTGVIEETAPIDDSEVQGWHDALLKQPVKLAYLRDERGLTDDTIKLWRLGHDGDRYTIPIVLPDGTITNVRRYKPRSTQKMISYAQNYGGTQLLGQSLLANAKLVIIGEGEFDAILANQHGFVTVTATNGAGRWRKRWNDLFRGKHVILCQDNDKSGRKGNLIIAKELFGVAASVRIVVWPKDFPDKSDISDWFIKQGKSNSEFQQLLDLAVTFEPKEEEALVEYAFSDDGNSQRFITKYTKQFLFCDMWNAWLVWDGVRWRKDEVQGVLEKGKVLLRDLTEGAQKELEKELAEHLLRSQHESRIKSMIHLASADPSVAIHPSQLDMNNWLLPCLNGVLDLKTGELTAADPDDLLTKSVPLQYDPAAKSATWELFLDTVTDNDAEMKTFLQRAIGSSLTGSTRDEKLFFIWGPTSSGKSTFLKAVQLVLGGDYAMAADFSTFLSEKHDSDSRSTIAKMKGMRFIVSFEVDEGKKLAEGLIKKLTGGDVMTGRFLFSEVFEYQPTAKFWLAANAKPRASDEDDAIWRRILLVPFDKTIANPNPSIKEELTDIARTGQAILAWAVQGCLEWQKEGLAVPEKIVAATKGYREEQNPITDWIEDCIAPYPQGKTSTADLYKAYVGWCKDNGIRYMIKAKSLTQRLQALNYTVVEGRGHQRFVEGIILRTTLDAQEEGKY